VDAHIGEARLQCPICDSATLEWTTVRGPVLQRSFQMRRCSSCGFLYIADPWLDFEQIYSEAYYAGTGSDPSVDYVSELKFAKSTIRHYEWRGIHRLVSRLVPLSDETLWLDYGCGVGGLVRYLRQQGVPNAIGFEEGHGVQLARELSIDVFDRAALLASNTKYDVITAVEVIEHIPDPVSALREMRTLLKPGGLVVLITGNAAPHRDRMTSWGYVLPEVHVSYFEPRSMARALQIAGFEPEFPGWNSGWSDIVRYKVLKGLRRKEISPLERLVPWSLVGTALERRMRFSALPIGWLTE
jgi:SAM-dependent methyltransferase